MLFLVRSASASRLCAAAGGHKIPARGFLTPPSLSAFLPGASEEPQTYHERKIFPYVCVVFHLGTLYDKSHRYRPSQLYKVVKDVENYPHFLPYCVSARVLSRTPPAGPTSTVKMEAELTVRFLALEASYTSLVTCIPNQSVEVRIARNNLHFLPLITCRQSRPRLVPCSRA